MSSRVVCPSMIDELTAEISCDLRTSLPLLAQPVSQSASTTNVLARNQPLPNMIVPPETSPLVALVSQSMQHSQAATAHFHARNVAMSQPVHPEGLSMLEKRKIEAEILKEVYETLKQSHGEEVAKKTIAESVRRSEIAQARAFAAAAPDGPSLKAFQDVMPLWTKGGALEVEVKEQSDRTFAFNVVRCRYAETYKAMGLG